MEGHKFRDGRTDGRREGGTDGRRTPEGHYIVIFVYTNDSKSIKGLTAQVEFKTKEHKTKYCTLRDGEMLFSISERGSSEEGGL